MRSRGAVFALALALCTCMLLLGCGSSNSNSNPPGSSPLITTSTLPAGVVNTAYSATIAATGGTTPYSWSVTSGSLPAGLSLSSSGTISGTPTTAGTSSFAVQVRDSNSKTATGTLSITITAPVSITTTSLPGGTAGVMYSATLTATGGMAPYNWKITTGTLPAGLSLNATSGAITGTPTTAGTSSFTVQVSDSSSPANSATASLGITINQSVANAALKGSYAFSVNGYSPDTSHPIFVVGSFVADGTGVITSGVLDENTTAAAKPAVMFTGTYAIQPNGLGTMTLNLSPSGVFNFSVSVFSTGTATHGSLVLPGPAPAPVGSGVFKAQSPATTLDQLIGTFASGFSGIDHSITREAGAGAYQIAGGSPHLLSGTADINDGGSLKTSTWNPSALPTPDPGTGRGFATLLIDGNLTHWVFYVVSANELTLLPVDPISASPFVGVQSMLRQATAAFDVTYLKGNSVIENTGITSQPATDVVLGLLTADGAGTATSSTDENAGGVVTQQKAGQATYTVQANGRVVFTGFGANPPIVYLVNTNQGFIVGQDSGVGSGQLEPQSGSPYTNAAFLGNYWGGTVTPALAAVTNTVSWLFPDGNGTAIGTSAPGGDLGFTYTIDATGRGVASVDGWPLAIFYIVSPTKVALLPLPSEPSDTNPALGIGTSNP